MDGARRYSGRVTTPRFAAALNAQIGNEFAAHLQYIAVAVHFDALTMPRMASFFYQQAREERDHAMMMVRYLLDTEAEVTIPGDRGTAVAVRWGRRADRIGARPGASGDRSGLWADANRS